MKYAIGFAIACVLWAIALAYIDVEVTQYKVYDCSMAEWHPDIPPNVKEECRRKATKERKDGTPKNYI